MAKSFPAVGKCYLVTFTTFTVELHFTSITSLTYTVIGKGGHRGPSETVTIRVEELRDDQFLVTWQESDKTVVVHVEDYARHTIVTNITNPDLTFVQDHGTFVQIRHPAEAVPA